LEEAEGLTVEVVVNLLVEEEQSPLEEVVVPDCPAEEAVVRMVYH
jgi:hypothetical protein